MLVNVGYHYAFVLFLCMSTYAFPIFLYLKEKSKVFIYTYIQMTIALVDKVVSETVAISARSVHTYNYAPWHFMQSLIRKVYTCLAVTCHPHFWQNDRIFYVLLR